jgi:hypothetical protein
MSFQLAYQNVLKAGYDVNLNQIEALIDELRQIFYQLQCSTHFQVSVASLDRELLTVYQADVAYHSNKQASLLASLIFPPLAVALEQARLAHQNDHAFSALFQVLQLQQMNHNDVLVNRYIRYQLFSPYAEKVEPYTPIRHYLFLATRRLLNELNPSANPQQNILVDSLGYSWEAINSIMEGSSEGLALLKLYYEQPPSGKVALNQIPRVLKKRFRKSKDGLVELLWEQIQESDLSQLSKVKTTFDQLRISKRKSRLNALILSFWLLVIGILGVHLFNYFGHHIRLKKENDKLLIELKKQPDPFLKFRHKFHQ